jgi:hypothetical protein
MGGFYFFPDGFEGIRQSAAIGEYADIRLEKSQKSPE